MRQDVHQVHLLSAFSCPCAGGDVQGAYSEKIVLDFGGPVFPPWLLAGGYLINGGGFSLFDVSKLYFSNFYPRLLLIQF